MSDKEETVVIDCGESLNIAGVGDLYAELLALLAEGKPVAFNVSQVERVDAASLQMLYAFSKEAEEQGNPLEWEQPSDAFYSSVKLLGLEKMLN
ncbi:MAG: STAS domain-containing protein [Gammaproteobacteria bacterium]|nr:STAS domain-containing protein [Gammaproteobacteria bacterium]MDH5592257.1 STAS domain-containing protein [Gammaproteobacteria bacterium]